jgi:hypothetical protein
VKNVGFVESMPGCAGVSIGGIWKVAERHTPCTHTTVAIIFRGIHGGNLAIPGGEWPNGLEGTVFIVI